MDVPGEKLPSDIKAYMRTVVAPEVGPGRVWGVVCGVDWDAGRTVWGGVGWAVLPLAALTQGVRACV